MPSPSATVLILRDANEQLEVLMVQRNRQLQVGGGRWVYPGGRVDAADYRDDSDEFIAARNAAVREVQEESGLVIGDDALLPIAHWTTPPGPARRYATWFFVATADGDVVVDGGEIVDHRWMSPADVLAARAAGEMAIMPPGFVTLNWLLPFADSRSVLEAFRARDVEHFKPRIIETDTGRIILYQQDAGYAQGDMHASGPRHRLDMRDDDWRYIRELD